VNDQCFEQISELEATGGVFQNFHDGGDALGKNRAGVDGARAHPRDEHFARATLERLEAAAVETCGEFLRHLEKMFACCFDGLPEHDEQGWGELPFVEIAGHRDIAHFFDGRVGVMAAEVGFHFETGIERRRGFEFGLALCRSGGDGVPTEAFFLIVLPLLDELGIGVIADAAFVVLQGKVGEAFAMQSDQAGLEAVMAGRSEDFTAEAADGDGWEIALGFFHFEFFGTVEGVECAAAEDVLEGLITGEEKAAVSGDLVERLRVGLIAKKADTEALAACENKACDIKEAKGMAGGTNVSGEGVQRLVIGVNGDGDAFWDIHPLALRGVAPVAIVTTAGAAAGAGVVPAVAAGTAARAFRAKAWRAACGAAGWAIVVAAKGRSVPLRRAAAVIGEAVAWALVTVTSAATLGIVFAVAILADWGVSVFAKVGDPSGHDLEVGKIQAAGFGGLRHDGLWRGRMGGGRAGFWGGDRRCWGGVGVAHDQ
jgi:hypothetical protein